MRLYDEILSRWQEILKQQNSRKLPLRKKPWPEVTDRSMILRREMAYELGGEGKAALGGTLITSDESLVPADEILLIGQDLQEIKADVPYARLACIRVREEAMGEGKKLYAAIRDLEFTRYHFYPEGFMMRVSASRDRESVRVASAALKKGLDFSAAGSLMIQAFHRHEAVEAVKLIYVTAPEFPFKEIEKDLKEADGITGTIDHILKNVPMDCSACSLQQICDEVEGLKELHFAQTNQL